MRNKVEFILHVVFLVLLASSINVEWTADWFDQSIRPKTPAPLSFVAFVLFFYVNAFNLIPKYFNRESWKKYVVLASVLFILPEILRILFYSMRMDNLQFMSELFGRDSLIFGAPSPFFMALNSSFIYRLVMDRIFRNRTEDNADRKSKPTTPYENTQVITASESKELQDLVKTQLEDEKIYLDADVTLRALAERINTSEKKLSYLLNQHMSTNFYELMNSYRVEHFKNEVVKSENKSLSIVGLALNCGFPSKSSFYRAFKANVGTSPSQYLKTLDSQ